MKKDAPNIEKLIREERIDYYRKWREKNKDKVRQFNQNYWKHRIEKKLQGGK